MAQTPAGTNFQKFLADVRILELRTPFSASHYNCNSSTSLPIENILGAIVDFPLLNPLVTFIFLFKHAFRSSIFFLNTWSKFDAIFWRRLSSHSLINIKYVTCIYRVGSWDNLSPDLTGYLVVKQFRVSLAGLGTETKLYQFPILYTVNHAT